MYVVTIVRNKQTVKHDKKKKKKGNLDESLQRGQQEKYFFNNNLVNYKRKQKQLNYNIKYFITTGYQWR